MLTREAIEFLMEQGIDPNNRLVGLVDTHGNERTFFINKNGDHTEVYPHSGNAKETLVLSTLTSLVDYIKSNLDNRNQMILHVNSHLEVEFRGILNDMGQRETLAAARAIVPSFGYERFHDAEELIIALQSMFTRTEDRDLLLKVIGNVKEENVRNTGDTGFSQAVTIKTGVSNVDDVIVPNPVTLAPYRTFLEVDQPASDFIFRMKDGPRGAIFEADGGAWRNAAIANVRDYLTDQLSEEIEAGKITIIA